MSSVCVLSLILSSSLLSVSALLSGPNNVRLSSSNLNLVLRWDPEESSSELLYTAQYKSSVTDYRTGCDGTSEVECDFSSLDINEYGEYQGRVRLQRGEEHSAWVESNTITPDKDTPVNADRKQSAPLVFRPSTTQLSEFTAPTSVMKEINNT